MTASPTKYKVDYIPDDKSSFVINEGDKRIAEMVVGLAEDDLSVYHTGVEEEYQDMGLGQALVDALANYARRNNLKLNIFCPYVKKNFRQHPEKYGDIFIHRPTSIKLE